MSVFVELCHDKRLKQGKNAVNDRKNTYIPKGVFIESVDLQN